MLLKKNNENELNNINPNICFRFVLSTNTLVDIIILADPRALKYHIYVIQNSCLICRL